MDVRLIKNKDIFLLRFRQPIGIGRTVAKVGKDIVVVVYVEGNVFQDGVPVNTVLPRFLAMAPGAQGLNVVPSMGLGSIDGLHLDVIHFVGIGQHLLAQVAFELLATGDEFFFRFGQAAAMGLHVPDPLGNDHR